MSAGTPGATEITPANNEVRIDVDGTTHTMPPGAVMRFLQSLVKSRLGEDATCDDITKLLLREAAKIGSAIAVEMELDAEASKFFVQASISHIQTTASTIVTTTTHLIHEGIQPLLNAEEQARPIPTHPPMNETISAPVEFVGASAAALLGVHVFLSALGVSYCSEFVVTTFQKYCAAYYPDPNHVPEPGFESAIAALFAGDAWRNLVDKQGEKAGIIRQGLWFIIANAPLAAMSYYFARFSLGATALQTATVQYLPEGGVQTAYSDAHMAPTPADVSKFYLFMSIMAGIGAYRFLGAAATVAHKTYLGKIVGRALNLTYDAAKKALSGLSDATFKRCSKQTPEDEEAKRPLLKDNQHLPVVHNTAFVIRNGTTPSSHEGNPSDDSDVDLT